MDTKKIKLDGESIKAGQAMQNTAVGDVVFDALDNDPSTQAALEELLQNQDGSLKEEDLAGQYMLGGGMLGVASKHTAMSKAAWSGFLTKSLGPAAMGVLKSIGIAVPAAAGGALVGYLIYKGLISLSGKSKTNISESRRRNMKLTKRQLKRIIREEYSKLKRQGLLREMSSDDLKPYDDDEPLHDPRYCAEKDFMQGEYGDSCRAGDSEEWLAAYDAAYKQTEEDYEDYLADQDPTRYTPSYSRSSSLSYPGEYYDPEWGDSPKDREH